MTGTGWQGLAELAVEVRLGPRPAGPVLAAVAQLPAIAPEAIVAPDAPFPTAQLVGSRASDASSSEGR